MQRPLACGEETRCNFAGSSITLSQTVRSTGVSSVDASPANYLDWAAQNAMFAIVGTSQTQGLSLGRSSPPLPRKLAICLRQVFGRKLARG